MFIIKFIDEMLSTIGILFALFVLAILGTLAYYNFPITTCIIGGLIGISYLVSFIESLNISLSEKQKENVSKTLVIIITLTVTGFALYFFPKTTAVLLFLIALGFVGEKIEKRKKQIKPLK